MCIGNLANVLLLQKKLDEAEELTRRALEISSRAKDGNPMSEPFLLNRLSGILEARGQLEEAERVGRQALAKHRGLFGDNHPMVPNIVINLAAILAKQGKDAETEKLYQEFLPGLPEVHERSARLLETRGAFFARRARWQVAAADFSRVIELRPAGLTAWHSLAALVLQKGNLDAYREHCRSSLKQFGKSTDANTVLTIAKDCLILTPTAADLGIIAALLENSPAAEASDAFGLPASTRALAAYRQGHVAEAVDTSQRALRSSATDSTRKENPGPPIQAQIQAVLAMARWQLKESDLARAALAEVINFANTKMPKIGSGDLGEDWAEWIIVQTLLREARELIEETTPNAVAPGTPVPQPKSK